MEITIEKLIYGGDGLARVVSGPRAKTIFVPYVLPGERVEATMVEDKPGFGRARLDRVLEVSKQRSTPQCPYFGRCGGCQYQHIGYEDQLCFKAEILKESLRRVAKLEIPIEIQIHASPPYNYRNRTRFHLRATPEFAIGYFRHGSRDLLPVRECPISSPIINRALEELWKLGAAQHIPSAIDEVEVFANERDDELLIDLYIGVSERSEAMREFAQTFARSFPAITGIVALSDSRPTGKSASTTDLLWGKSTISYRVDAEIYRVSAGAFFQTNRHLLGRMVEVATSGREGKLALDLYSGVGLFALPLARRFERVIAVESSPISADDLRSLAPGNVKVSGQTTEKYLISSAGKHRPELVLADPPRSGLGAVVCREIAKLPAQELVYVSCDPATLARDLKQLASSGFRIVEMHLLDLFPQTFHIETLSVLRR